jgi:hypothetical protein
MTHTTITFSLVGDGYNQAHLDGHDYSNPSDEAVIPNYLENLQKGKHYPSYMGTEYDTQHFGIVKSYTRGRNGTLPDGKKLQITITYQEHGDPTHLSVDEGHYIISDEDNP